MQVHQRPIETITPYANNPRHNDSAVEIVMKSIQEFGFRQPIVIDKQGVIVVGHTRFKAARKLGMLEVPVHVAEGLSPAQLQAYRIADNQTATIATWDDDKLTQELLDLQKQDYSLDLTGFDNEDLTRLIGNITEEGATDPDVIPEPPDKAITQKGASGYSEIIDYSVATAAIRKTWITYSKANGFNWLTPIPRTTSKSNPAVITPSRRD